MPALLLPVDELPLPVDALPLPLLLFEAVGLGEGLLLLFGVGVTVKLAALVAVPPGGR